MNTLSRLFAQARIGADEIGLDRVDDPNSIIGNVLDTVYLAAGIVAVVIIVVAGYIYTTSGGNSANTKRAREAILYALVGLGVVLMAFIITQFVIGRF